MTVDRDRDAFVLGTAEALALAEPTCEDIDPEKTLVREDWESTVIRRVASHVAAVQNSIAAEGGASEKRFGWESEGLRRLAQELQRSGAGLGAK
jgi:hypothetical protein